MGVRVFVAISMNTNSGNGKKEQDKTKLADIKSAEIENPVLFSLLLTLIISYHDASCNHRKIMKRSQW